MKELLKKKKKRIRDKKLNFRAGDDGTCLWSQLLQRWR
jgi:hypothetical protein